MIELILLYQREFDLAKGKMIKQGCDITDSL